MSPYIPPPPPHTHTALQHICSGAQWLSVKHESLRFELTAAHLESCLASKCSSNPIGWRFSKSFPYWAIKKLPAKVSVSTTGNWKSQWCRGEGEAGADGNRVCQCFECFSARNNEEPICTLLIQIHPTDHISLGCLPRTHANTHANTHTLPQHVIGRNRNGFHHVWGNIFRTGKGTKSTKQEYQLLCVCMCVHVIEKPPPQYRKKIVPPTSTAVIPVSFHLRVESKNRSEWQRHEIEDRETKTVRRRER